MSELSREDLHEIVGGGNGVTLGFLIAAGITFIIGVIDGYVRPLRCN